MNRQDAVTLFKELQEKCPELYATHLMLMPPNADNVLSKGYQIHIKPSIDEHTRQCVEPIVVKHSLAFKQDTQVDVIYRPLNASK